MTATAETIMVCVHGCNPADCCHSDQEVPMNIDPFVAIRARLAKEAAKRDDVARWHRLAQDAGCYESWRIPATSAPQEYAAGGTLEDVCRAAATCKAGRAKLARRRREHMQSMRNLDLTRNGRYGMPELLDVRTLAELARIDREYRLTADARRIIRLVRDAAARETLAAEGDTYMLPDAVAGAWAPTEDSVERSAALAAETPGSNRAWRGIIPTSETRVNVRGAYGKRGVKVQPGKQVSTRDNRVPTWALRNLKTVGLATVPGVTEWGASTVTELMEYVRRDRKRATLRVWLPTYDVAAQGGVVTLADHVVYADDYAPADPEYLDAAGRTQHHAIRGGIPQNEAAMGRQRMDMAALAERGAVGYIGNNE